MPQRPLPAQASEIPNASYLIAGGGRSAAAALGRHMTQGRMVHPKARFQQFDWRVPMHRSPFPLRDDSLDRAAQQIMRILEREERDAMKRRAPRASHSAGVKGGVKGGAIAGAMAGAEECPSCRAAAKTNPSHGSLDRAEGRFFVPGGGPAGLLAGAPLSHPDVTDATRAGITPVSAVPMPGAGPFPIIIPEVAIPGSDANQEFVDYVTSVIQSLRRILSPEEEEECEAERNAAWEYCRKFLKNNSFGGGKTVSGADFDQCMRGQISEKCGGNPVEEPSEGRRRRR